MRSLILAAALGAVGLTAVPAEAQQNRYHAGYRHDARDARQDCRRAIRNADNRWEYRRAQQRCHRELRQVRRERYRDGNHWRYR